MNKEHGITRENLLFTLPRAIAGDQSLTALGDGTARLLTVRKDETDIPRIFPDIDRLDEAVLDILAYDFKADWYDYDYPLKTKREIIKGSVLAHKRLGTVYAVKSVLNSLYPDSALEEWFSYGGKPGCFRLNVNVTGSGADGAVIVYSPEEIATRIKTVKRLSAHLENVSYMVRNAIVAGHRIDSWQYRVPECNALRCGTWWMPSTLGWEEKPALRIGADPGPALASPELSGMLPDTAERGYSVCGALRIGGTPEGYTDCSASTGTEPCGTVWTPPVLGWSERHTVTGAGKAEPFAVSPELTGTLPEEAQHGERED